MKKGEGFWPSPFFYAMNILTKPNEITQPILCLYSIINDSSFSSTDTGSLKSQDSNPNTSPLNIVAVT